jgi:hypothetical protein
LISGSRPVSSPRGRSDSSFAIAQLASSEIERSLFSVYLR